MRVSPSKDGQGINAKTAFVCQLGQCQYRKMPFGLTSAPATFQRLMSQLFSSKDWEFVTVYLDVLIASQNIKKHLEHVEKVLVQLSEAGLRLKPSKCVFVANEIEYLGHILTAKSAAKQWQSRSSEMLPQADHYQGS